MDVKNFQFLKMQNKKHFHIFSKEIKDKDIIHYDVCILGGGPAGLTAGIYSSRYGLHTALITKDIGGMALLAEKIENYPGFVGSGIELMQKFSEQAISVGTEFLNSEVANLDKDRTGFVIELINGKVVHSKALIIALGTEKKKLEVEGEEKFLGRGISYCASCDAYFFKNKNVAVIGGSDSACKAALLLAGIAKKVYIIYRGNELRCEKIENNRIIQAKNIEIICNSVPIKVKGKEKVESLIVKEKNKKQEIKLDGVFIEIGAIPVTAIVKKLGLKIDKDGYIKVNEEMKTNAKGVFAAGDAVKSKLKQVVVAASQGALAAKSAYEYIS